MKAIELKSSSNKDDKIDMLFLVKACNAEFRKTEKHGEHFLLSGDAHTLVFSDGPFSGDKTLAGGALHFANFYSGSDFKKNAPSLTFSGVHHATNTEIVTLCELGSPVVLDSNVLLPIKQWVGDTKPLLVGKFSDVTFVIDNICGEVLEVVTVNDVLEATCLPYTVEELNALEAESGLCSEDNLATAVASYNVATA